jgi:hypothetical protein
MGWKQPFPGLDDPFPGLPRNRKPDYYNETGKNKQDVDNVAKTVVDGAVTIATLQFVGNLFRR